MNARDLSPSVSSGQRWLEGVDARRVLAVGLVVVVAALLVLTGLDRESLLGDEALYASVARDSLRSGSLFPLEYDGTAYAGKPPTWIWAIAASFRMLGVNELAARLPSALAGLMAIALFAAATARRYGALTALIASLLLVSGHHLLFRHGLRQAVFEGPLLLATTGFVLAVTDSTLAPRSRILTACFFSCLGAAIKGLAAPAFVLAFTLALWLVARRWRLPSDLLNFSLVALAAGLGVWALWVISLTHCGIASLREATIVEAWSRHSVGLDPEHLQGPLFYFGVVRREMGLLLLLAPLAFLGSDRLHTRGPVQEAPPWAVALAWGLGPLALYSLSASKLAWYLVPSLPGLALLVGLGARRFIAHSARIHVAVGMIALLLVLSPLALRLDSRWRRVTGSRPEQVTLRLVVEEARADSRAQIVIDAPTHPGSGPVREWHWFYLGQFDRLLRSLDAPRDPQGCALVVTSDPDNVRAQPAWVGAPVLPVHAVTTSERPLWVVDGCGGAIVARAAARAAP